MHIGPIGKLFPPPGIAFFSFFGLTKFQGELTRQGRIFLHVGGKNAIFDLRYEGRWLL